MFCPIGDHDLIARKDVDVVGLEEMVVKKEEEDLRPGEDWWQKKR